MFKKVTIAIICLLIFFSVAFVEASDLRQDRKRLERIWETVEIIEEQASARGKEGVVAALSGVREKIQSLYIRVEEKSNTILESAMEDGESVQCYFTKRGDIERELKVRMKDVGAEDGGMLAENTADSEFIRILLLKDEGYMWIEDENYAIDLSGETEESSFLLEEKFLPKFMTASEFRREFYDCFYTEIDDGLFKAPKQIVPLEDVWEDLFLATKKAFNNDRISSSLDRLRSIAEMQRTVNFWEDNYIDLFKFDDPENEYYKQYSEIQEKIEDSGGELIIKFSKDFGEENGYDKYCAYSVLNKGEGEKVYCVDYDGTRKKGLKEEVGCVTGVAPNCKAK